MSLLELDPRVARFDQAVDDEIHGYPNGDAGGGGDVSGLTESENTGHLVDAMAARFADEDAKRMAELNRLTKTGPQPVEEEPMAKVKRGDPKPCCGSRASRHTSTCKEAAKSDPPDGQPAKVAAKKPARLETIRRAVAKVQRETEPEKMGLTEMSVAELLELRGQVQDELERREEELRSQLEAIRVSRKAEAA